MKAIIKYTYNLNNNAGYYDNSGRFVKSGDNCFASLETKDPRNNSPMVFSGFGKTYDEAKKTAMETAKSFFANRETPDPEIVEL